MVTKKQKTKKSQVQLKTISLWKILSVQIIIILGHETPGEWGSIVVICHQIGCLYKKSSSPKRSCQNQFSAFIFLILSVLQ